MILEWIKGTYAIKQSSNWKTQSRYQWNLFDDDWLTDWYFSNIKILELKIKKLEQLLKLKDSKIQTLQNKLAQNGIY